MGNVWSYIWIQFPLKTKEKHNKGPLRENSSSAFEKMQALTLWSK